MDKEGIKNSHRGQAAQIDFLNAMIITIFIILTFFAATSALFASQQSNSQADLRGIATTADDRLANDLLLDDPNTAFLNRSCTDAYFNQVKGGGCGIVGFESGSTELQWLQYSLGIRAGIGVNLTITDLNTIQSSPVDSVDYALGPEPPTDRRVSMSTRYVSFGNGEYQTLTVRVWQDV
jgi:hypothetical protein